MGRADVVQRLAVEQDERVHVHEATKPVREQLRELRDDGAAVAVADEDNLAEVGPDDRIGSRGDGIRVADGAVDVAAPLSGERRRVDVVAGRSELSGHVGPATPVVPGPVDEDVGAHHPASTASMPSSTRWAIANAPFAAGTPQ